MVFIIFLIILIVQNWLMIYLHTIHDTIKEVQFSSHICND